MMTTSKRFGFWTRRLSMAVIVSALSGAVLTHYFEPIQEPWAKRLRTFVYAPPPWHRFDQLVRSSDAKGLASIDERVISHPGRAWLSASYNTWCVLSRELRPPPLAIALGRLLYRWPQCRNTVNEQHLLNIANWYLTNAERVHFAGVDAMMFAHQFPVKTYSIAPPWYSGMAQARAGQVLLAAYFITEDREYLEAAILAANGLRIPVVEGGVSVSLEDGSIWFEEYASPDFAGRTPLVLNGHMFAMEILYWLRQLDPEWDVLYRSANRAVNSRIHQYIAWSWSYYDLQKNYANGFYHNVHILQLRQLSEIFGHGRKIERSVASMERSRIIPLGIFERLIFQSNRMLIFLWIVNTGVSVLFMLTAYALARCARRFVLPGPTRRR